MAHTPGGAGPVVEEQFFSKVAPGEFIFRENEPGAEMFIIQEGEVEIVKQIHGDLRQVAVLEEGDFFGEMAILEDMPRTAAARALTQATLLRIDRTTFNQLIRHNPEISVRMLRKLCHRLRMTNPALLDGGVQPQQPVAPALAAAPAAAPGAPSPATEPSAPEPAVAVGQVGGTHPELPTNPRLVHGDSGTEFRLWPDGETIIGRFDPVTGVQPEVDLKPVDVHRSTSRRHAVIHGREGSFFVREEVGCANGTFVNGERLETGVEVEIHDGDALQFGLVKTLFRTSS
ncbi:MAG: cyclic nucleotide-binding domain-containing protein [Acidobacteria bacterium]|nr:cyclic nucleotide-binding domain-containing protein [Acidobacteriota bacterium]